MFRDWSHYEIQAFSNISTRDAEIQTHARTHRGPARSTRSPQQKFPFLCRSALVAGILRPNISLYLPPHIPILCLSPGSHDTILILIDTNSPPCDARALVWKNSYQAVLTVAAKLHKATLMRSHIEGKESFQTARQETKSRAQGVRTQRKERGRGERERGGIERERERECDGKLIIPETSPLCVIHQAAFSQAAEEPRYADGRGQRHTPLVRSPHSYTLQPIHFFPLFSAASPWGTNIQ